MSKEPTRHQLSSKLSYQGRTPAFLQRLQNRVAGVPDEDEDDEYEYDGSGRPPIPKRPPIPERPEDEPGSEGEDDGDEAPQIVVLKAGKHLSEREVENEKRMGEQVPASTRTLLTRSRDSQRAVSSIRRGGEVTRETVNDGKTQGS